MTQSIGLKDGDLYLDAKGYLAFVSGFDACMQNCETAMKAVKGEMMYATNKGVPYRETVWDVYKKDLFEAFARKTIQAVKDVKSIISFQQSMSAGVLKYSATIETIYGVGTLYG